MPTCLVKLKVNGDIVVAEDGRSLLVSSTTGVAVRGNSIFAKEEDLIRKSLGRAFLARVGADVSEDFGGLNLMVIALPVRKVELNREGSFLGLLAAFSSR
jgi:hypothetical protein